jgi:hypothetical protein
LNLCFFVGFACIWESGTEQCGQADRAGVIPAEDEGMAGFLAEEDKCRRSR